MKSEILRMDHITVLGDGNPVINQNSMQIFEGEIYGLLSLESHGIDKLVELICWNLPIASGQVFFQDNLVNSSEYSDRSRNKVSVINRLSSLIDDLSLSDNLFVMRPGFKRFTIPDRIIFEQTNLLLKNVNTVISPALKIRELSSYERIIVEIMRALIAGEKLIILNDISALISSEELKNLHSFMQEISTQGVSFLYIYNHHEVLAQVCDRIAIYKSSRVEKVFSSKESLKQHIHILAEYAYKRMSKMKPDASRSFSSIPYVLKFKNVCTDELKNISFSVKIGEIVLLIDKSNTILDQLVALIKRHISADSGHVLTSSIYGSSKCSISLIQRDPVNSILFPELSYIDNLCFLLADKVPFFWQKNHLAKSVIKEYKPILGDVLLENNLYHLTNKELYSLLAYRHIIAKPDLIIFVQPLSGADMYLRTHILKLITKMRENNIAVLILDTELFDSLNIVDWLIQVENGSITAEHARSNFDEAKRFSADIFPDL